MYQMLVGSELTTAIYRRTGGQVFVLRGASYGNSESRKRGEIDAIRVDSGDFAVNPGRHYVRLRHSEDLPCRS